MANKFFCVVFLELHYKDENLLANVAAIYINGNIKG